MRAFLLLLAFLSGGFVLGWELIAGKFLSPVFGSGLSTWATVLGITLVGLAGGYYAAAFMLSRYDNRKLLVILLTILSVTFTLAAPFVNGAISLINEPSSSALIFTALVLLTLPVSIMGNISPVVISIINRSVSTTGSTSGMVFAISTAGGVFVAIFTGFYLLPAIGPVLSSLLFAFITAFAAMAFAFSFNFLKIPAIASLIPLIFVFSTRQSPDKSKLTHVVHKEYSIYGELMVADINYPRGNNFIPMRLLLVNRIGQTNVNRHTFISLWDYIHYLSTMASVYPDGSETLILGIGAGSLAKEFSEMGLAVDAVDLDPGIYAVSKEFFGLPPDVNFIRDDARHYIRTTEEHYDIIVADLFSGESPPAHVLSLEAFEDMKKRLKPGGSIMINLHGIFEGEAGKGLRSVIKTIQEAGLQTAVVYTPGEPEFRNALVVASEDINHIFGRKPHPNPCCMNFHVPWPMQMNVYQEDDLKDAMILRDDQPVLEKLNQGAYRAWRKYAFDNYVKALQEQGIKPF